MGINNRINFFIDSNIEMLYKYFGKSPGLFFTYPKEYYGINRELTEIFGKEEPPFNLLKKEFNKVFLKKYQNLSNEDKINNLISYYRSNNKYKFLYEIKYLLEYEKDIFINPFEIEARFKYYAKDSNKIILYNKEYIKGFIIGEDDKKFFKTGFHCNLTKDGIISEDLDYYYSLQLNEPPINKCNDYTLGNSKRKICSLFVNFKDDYITFKMNDSEFCIYYDEILGAIIGNDYFRISTLDIPNLLITPRVSNRNKYILMILIEKLLISKNVKVEFIKPNF